MKEKLKVLVLVALLVVLLLIGLSISIRLLPFFLGVVCGIFADRFFLKK